MAVGAAAEAVAEAWNRLTVTAATDAEALAAAADCARPISTAGGFTSCQAEPAAAHAAGAVGGGAQCPSSMLLCATEVAAGLRAWVAEDRGSQLQPSQLTLLRTICRRESARLELLSLSSTPPWLCVQVSMNACCSFGRIPNGI